MKLYYFPGSCALAPHIVLNWLGTEYEAIRITKGDPEFLKVNPLGVVPTLESNGRIYTQADAILHWLAASHPAADLGGDGTPDSDYELNEWMAFLTGDLHPAFFPFFNTVRYTTDQSDEALAAVKAAAEERVAHYYAYLDRHLETREFIANDKRSIADAYAVPMLRWGRLLNKNVGEYPALRAYLERLEADGGVRDALIEQGLLKE